MPIIFAMLAAIIAVTIGGAIVINLTTALVTLGAAFLYYSRPDNRSQHNARRLNV